MIAPIIFIVVSNWILGWFFAVISQDCPTRNAVALARVRLAMIMFGIAGIVPCGLFWVVRWGLRGAGGAGPSLAALWRQAELPTPRLRRGPKELSAGQLSEPDAQGGEVSEP